MFRYSAINTAYSCLKKYELEYLLNERPDIKSGDMLFGTGIHLGIQSHFEGNDAVAQFEQFWATVSPKEYTFGRFDHDKLSDMGAKFLARWVRLHAKKFEPFRVEHSFKTKIGKHEFTGTPDFVGLYKGVPSIVDFKTSGTVYDKRKVLVNEQMPIYQYAVNKEWAYEAKQLVYMVFVKSEERIQEIITPVTDKLIKEAVDNVEMMCDDLSMRATFPKNKNSCLYCPHFKRCHNE